MWTSICQCRFEGDLLNPATVKSIICNLFMCAKSPLPIRRHETSIILWLLQCCGQDLMQTLKWKTKGVEEYRCVLSELSVSVFIPFIPTRQVHSSVNIWHFEMVGAWLQMVIYIVSFVKKKKYCFIILSKIGLKTKSFFGPIKAGLYLLQWLKPRALHGVHVWEVIEIVLMYQSLNSDHF